jgi:hypothetical protein
MEWLPTLKGVAKQPKTPHSGQFCNSPCTDPEIQWVQSDVTGDARGMRSGACFRLLGLAK